MRVGTKCNNTHAITISSFKGSSSTVSRPQLAYILFLAFGRDSEDTCCRSRGIEQLDFKVDHLRRHTASKVHGNIGVALRHTHFQTNPPAWRAGGVALTRQVQYHLNQVSNLHWIPRGPILCAFASSCQHRWLAAASPRRDGVSQSVSQAHSDFLSFHWMAKKERNYSKKCLKTSWQFLACSQVRTKGKWTIPRLLLHCPHTITRPHNALWTDT